MRRTAASKEGDDRAEFWMRWWWYLAVTIGNKRMQPEPVGVVARRMSLKQWRQVRAYPLEHYAQHRLSDEVKAQARAGAPLVTMQTAYRVGAMLTPLIALVISRGAGMNEWFRRMQASKPVDSIPSELGIVLAPATGAVVGRVVIMEGSVRVSLVPDPATALCLAIAEDISAHARLFQQCRLPRCGQPFIRASNQHWCSAKCGNYFRVTNKRIRADNERRRARGVPGRPEIQMLDTGAPDPAAQQLVGAITKMFATPNRKAQRPLRASRSSASGGESA